jgi:uncharacterized protein YdaU (DUF1376 family)
MAGDWIKKPPAFQFYADDFLAGTLDMSQEEVGAYIRLLCYQWNTGSIPVATEKQQRLAGGCVSVDVLAKFRLLPDGRLVNERLEQERNKQAEYRKQQSQKGKRSAENRQQRLNSGCNTGSTPVEIRLQPKGNSPSPSPSPNSNTHTLTPAPVELSPIDLPDWLTAPWQRLLEHLFATTGRRVDAIRAETMVMELMRRGEEKALADIEFTILKGGKSILDSANDFEKRTKRPGGGKQKEEPIF